jgi:hypothetical protein
MKAVKYFDTPFEASVARGLLESEGIQAVVLNENIGSAIPITLANPSMRPYVAVADEDYGRAAELLYGTVPGEVTECPECGSKDIKYGIAGRDGRKRAIKIMYVLLSLLGGGSTGNIRSVRYCGRCSKEF